MPIYEYECPGCNHRQEILQSLRQDADGLSCSVCGGSELRKLYSTFASNTSKGARASSTPAAGCCRGTFT